MWYLLFQRRNPIPLEIKGEISPIKVPKPEIFFYHKMITFVMRSANFKRDKDLFYAYFIPKFYPDREALAKEIRNLKKDDYFDAFRQNIKEYLSDFSSPGYLILRPFLRSWIDEAAIDQEIRTTFSDIFEIL